MDPLKIVIAGSRTITDLTYVLDAMDHAVKRKFIQPRSSYEIVSGGAIGVDTLARDYAHKFNYPLREFIPDYDKYGRGAPLRRNADMAIYGDILIAIWDGNSRGTQHMISQMEKKNKPVFLYKIN